MGCYMSQPDHKVYVTEGKGKNFAFATASCQGWRREQEDAEECIPDFDDNASLFVLCDGHGGAEVAHYTVKHLPEFIKNHPLYKEGNYGEALRKAFVEFDIHLQSPKTLRQLELASERTTEEANQDKNFRVIDLSNGSEVLIDPKDDENKDDKKTEETLIPGTSGGSSSKTNESTIADDVDPDTLRKEAQVPLKQLLEQYSEITNKRIMSLKSNYQPSPVIRPKKETGDSSEDPKVTSTSTSSEPSDEVKSEPQPSSSNGDDPTPSSSSPSPDEFKIEGNFIKQVMQRYFSGDDSDSEDDSEFDVGHSSNEDGDDEDDENAGEGSTKKHRLKHKRQTKGPNPRSSEDSDDWDEDDDDEDEEDDEEDDDDEGIDDEDEESEGSEREDDSEDVDHDEDESKGDPDSTPAEDFLTRHSRVHRPGYDSGCTVVVALAKDGKLYVANAGDSRCIVIKRNGDCKPMSFDHKPEDARERRRINKAGGKVTEGRVNGGLNLSRAFGDFIYKNKDLDPKDQMITPLPDVETVDLDPNEVDYIFLACDGIWNSMTNRTTANFIRKEAPTVNHNLVDICVSLFRECIAPNTEGDGTGCDNMTCILVKFEKPETGDSNSTSDLNVKQEEHDSIDSTSCKRSSPSEDPDSQNSKRQCLQS